MLHPAFPSIVNSLSIQFNKHEPKKTGQILFCPENFTAIS